MTTVFSRLSRSWIWIKIFLADSIQSSFTLSVWALAIRGGVLIIIIWRWSSFVRMSIYKISESAESPQRRKGHTLEGFPCNSKGNIINWMVRRFGKLLTTTWEYEMVRTSMSCREKNSYRWIRTFTSIRCPKNVTEVFKYFQMRTVARYSLQTQSGHWSISPQTNTPYLWGRCKEGYTEYHDKNIANLWKWIFFERFFLNFPTDRCWNSRTWSDIDLDRM